MPNGQDAILEAVALAIREKRMPEELSFEVLFAGIIAQSEDIQKVSAKVDTVDQKVQTFNSRLSLLERLGSLLGGISLAGVGYVAYLILQHITAAK